MDKRGILIPFRITPGAADVVVGSGDDLRETRIGVIFGTRATSANSVGELSWDHDRGSKLDALRNAALSPAVADFAALYLEEALAAALPDESLVGVDVVIDETSMSITAETALVSDRDRARHTLSTSTSFRR